MKLAVLTDNISKNKDFLSEPGLSYYIEADNRKILFDTGLSSVYLKNAQKLNIDLSQTEYMVFSHGHDDHTKGLKYWPYETKKINVVCHPDCFLPKYKLNKYIGSPLLKKEIKQRYKYLETKSAYYITDNIVFLGEIKQKYSFEKRKKYGLTIKENKKIPDMLFDDSAMAISTKKGTIIVSGCSHSGICNIIAAAEKAFDKNIYSVIGGFHLRNTLENKMKKIINVFQEKVTGPIYPAHCTDNQARKFFSKHLNTKKIYTGKTINF